MGDSKDVTSFKLTAADTAADNTALTLKGVATTDSVNLATSYAGGNTLTSATVTYDAVTGTSDSATLAAGGNITDVLVAGIETATLNATALQASSLFRMLLPSPLTLVRTPQKPALLPTLFKARQKSPL